MKTKISILILAIIALASCDKVSPEFNDFYYTSDTITNSNGGGDDTTETAVQKAFIVDFTGHRCVNCPDAHEVLEQLMSIHGDKIIAIAVHGTLLAYPTGEYTYDFRTQTGNEILMEMGVSAIPIGLVNSYNKNDLLSHTAWTDKVEADLQNEPTIKIDIEPAYNQTANEITAEVKIIALTELSQNLKLVVYLTESHIVQPQAIIEEPGIIEHYEHNHVFRGSLTEIFGEATLTNPASTEDEQTHSLTISLDDTDWIPANCHIVAFVYDDETKKVVNAEEKHVE